jgi:hypothetical protein
MEPRNTRKTRKSQIHFVLESVLQSFKSLFSWQRTGRERTQRTQEKLIPSLRSLHCNSADSLQPATISDRGLSQTAALPIAVCGPGSQTVFCMRTCCELRQLALRFGCGFAALCSLRLNSIRVDLRFSFSAKFFFACPVSFARKFLRNENGFVLIRVHWWLDSRGFDLENEGDSGT